MHGEVLSGNCTGNGHRIKDLHEQVINLDIEALQDFITESKCLGHVARLMIASQEHNVLREVQLD